MTSVIELDACGALGSTLAGVEAGGGVIQGRTGRQERVGSNCFVYLVLVSVDVYLSLAMYWSLRLS